MKDRKAWSAAVHGVSERHDLATEQRALAQFSSVAQSCLTLGNTMDLSHEASLSITNSWSLLKLMSIELAMPSNHLILCHPLLLLPSMFPSIRVFSNELVLRVKRPKYWSFSFSISPSNEHPGLVSFRMDWLNLLAVQGTLKCLLQHHSSKASILWCSAFFIGCPNTVVNTADSIPAPFHILIFLVAQFNV